MPIYVKAQAKGVDMTPRKIGLVASLVRGRTVSDALVILSHTPKRAAIPVIKVIESAKANAQHNHNVVTDNLVISELHVSPGPRMKRFRPVARGSAHPYQKKTTHITVIVAGEEKAKPKAATTVKTTAPKSAKSKKESK
ncbi:50S ribosomal protein L22 [Candidatus Saccharibacteria bacterium]|nr:50S ribosomal protein L22 [Candidatus Saccharibacteria bacterium]